MIASLPDPNLREKVLHQIRFEVVTGEVEPGKIYSVPSLARTLGISTTPIREALLQLTSDGLLQPLRNRGFRVVDPSLDELRNLFEVRVQLETAAFIKLADMGLPDTRELTARADAMATAVASGDLASYLSADRAFHLELLTQAGNTILADIVMRLRDKMRLYGIKSELGRARQKASVGEHYSIIEAVKRRGDIDLMALMTRHIMDWQPVFTEAVQARARAASLNAR